MTNQQRKSMKEDKYLKMIRDSEDYHDTIDCENETRKELKERQIIMNETRLPKRQDSINPIHIVYDKIKAHINDFTKKTMITGMGGPQIQDSDRFSTTKGSSK